MYIDINRHHFIRDLMCQKQIHVDYISPVNSKAEILNKPLPKLRDLKDTKMLSLE